MREDLLMFYPVEYWVKCGTAPAVELKLDIFTSIKETAFLTSESQ